MRILRFPIKLDVERPFKLALPIGSEILTAQTKNFELCIWAKCPDDTYCGIYVFRIYPTGIEMDKGVSHKYISTFQTEDTEMGTLVFHVFQLLDQ